LREKQALGSTDDGSVKWRRATLIGCCGAPRGENTPIVNIISINYDGIDDVLSISYPVEKREKRKGDR
jgi:hypothetical protein